MLESLHLKNFKCFADQAIQIGDLTILSGMNGMGKSTVLQALLLLRQSYLHGVLPETGLVLNGDLVRIGTARDALFEGASQEDRIEIELKWRSSLGASWVFAYDAESELLRLDSWSVPNTVYQQSLFRTDCLYLNAERIGPRTAFETSDYLVRENRQLGNRGEFAAYFLARFGRQINVNTPLLHPGAVSTHLIDQVDAWMGEISPGIRLRPNRHSEMDLVSLSCQFQTGSHVSNSYRVTNVGFGITYTLPIVVGLLAAQPGSLLLLENPEAHLHPRGQSQMGRLISSAVASGVQVLVETHSDHVLNGIRVAVHKRELGAEAVRIHFFERVEDDGQAISDVISPVMDDNGRLDRWPEGFFDEWDRNLTLLLRPGGDH